MTIMITFHRDLDGVDWPALLQDLVDDKFHNGRSTAQLRASFENSQRVVMAFDGERCIGNARALSDGIGNAYIADVWTHSAYRRHGVARTMIDMLTSSLPGQHIYLQTEEAIEFWTTMGFQVQPHGMSRVVGSYLQN